MSAGEKELNMVFDFAMPTVGMAIEDGEIKMKAWALPELKVAVAKAQLLTPSIRMLGHQSSRRITMGKGR
jgi:hypothetical protein